LGLPGAQCAYFGHVPKMGMCVKVMMAALAVEVRVMIVMIMDIHGAHHADGCVCCSDALHHQDVPHTLGCDQSSVGVLTFNKRHLLKSFS
jgi:hypothetical protein